MSKNKKNTGGGGFVYSTDPDFKPFAGLFGAAEDGPAAETPESKQVLRIWLERVKGGKEATLIKGYEGPEEKLEVLAKTLKSKCATGGGAKDGIIILQGDHRDKVLKMLADMGYKNVKKAGG